MAFYLANQRDALIILIADGPADIVGLTKLYGWQGGVVLGKRKWEIGATLESLLNTESNLVNLEVMCGAPSVLKARRQWQVHRDLSIPRT